MHYDADVVIVGAGPAGTASAIRMAQAGWRVVVIERDSFPRQVVCGECVSAGGLDLLDTLGVDFRPAAGPELRQLGWLSGNQWHSAAMPVCPGGNHAFGRAIGRDKLDALLLARAQAVGAIVLQPATMDAVRDGTDHFECEYSVRAPGRAGGKVSRTLTSAVIIDAHGSWNRGPRFEMESPHRNTSRRGSTDLFAFKATFFDTQLPTGFLPVLAAEGGYGGMVVANDGRTTLACCIRRSLLTQCRALAPCASAGEAVEQWLRRSCPHVARVLEGARRQGGWLSTGPVRAAVRLRNTDSIFRVGNAAGECHPLIGEGIGMALHSAVLLTDVLRRRAPGAPSAASHRAAHELYCSAWRSTFTQRLSLSRFYAQAAMHPVASRWVGFSLSRWPKLLTHSARWAGKARYSGPIASATREST